MRRLFFAQVTNKKSMLNKYSVTLSLLMSALLISACQFATIRSLDEDEEAKKGFVATEYVDSIWDEQFLPTVHERAVEFHQLIANLRDDQNAATTAHGSRSGTGAYSFITYGEAKVLAVDTDSRIGFMTIDIAPYDGEADASMAIGPVIRNRDTSLRDSVGFIQYNDFTNQTEFAEISAALQERVLTTVISPLDLTTIQGKTLNFYGTFMLSDINDLEIVPVTIEVVE